MKIGLVLSSPPGYSETFFNSKIKGLQKKGYSVILFVNTTNRDFDSCKVVVAPQVHRIKLLFLFEVLKQTFLLLPFLSRVLCYWKLEKQDGTSFQDRLKKTFLNAHLLKARVDWLHFGFTTTALGKETVAKTIGAKMAVSFRGFDINVYPLKHPHCYKKVFNYVDKVHSISIYLYEKAIRLGLSEAVPYEIITPATNISRVSLTETNENNPIVFVTVARLTWIKGLDIAIEALRLLKEKGTKFEYRIIGGGSQKDKERYGFQVYEAGLSSQVFFLGAMDHEQTISELESADVYLQPSLNEGFCNAVLEAQALGKLVIASNAGGLPENIAADISGFLFETGNPKDLGATIEKVLVMDTAEKQRIKQQAIARVKEKFTIKQQQESFVNFYTEIL